MFGQYNSKYIRIFMSRLYRSYQNNQSLLNIDIKTNDLKGLNIIAKEKTAFIKELLNNIIIIY